MDWLDRCRSHWGLASLSRSAKPRGCPSTRPTLSPARQQPRSSRRTSYKGSNQGSTRSVPIASFREEQRSLSTPRDCDQQQPAHHGPTPSTFLRLPPAERRTGPAMMDGQDGHESSSWSWASRWWWVTGGRQGGGPKGEPLSSPGGFLASAACLLFFFRVRCEACVRCGSDAIAQPHTTPCQVLRQPPGRKEGKKGPPHTREPPTPLSPFQGLPPSLSSGPAAQ